jgi:hypothetical protein
MPNSYPNKILPSQNFLRACFDYDPENGALTWKQRPQDHFVTTRAWKIWNTRYARKPAGVPKKRGECQIGIAGDLYLAHRVIWKWMTGRDPPNTIDHKDRKPNDNRWEQLRLATVTEQNWNQERKTKSKSGFRGVVQRNRKFQAEIRSNGVKRHLGYFATAEEAARIYEIAAMKERGQFHYWRSP